MPKAAKPEVLHSGAYWQDLCRRKKEREAHRHRAQEELPVSLLGDVGQVVTLSAPPVASRAKPRPVVTSNSITHTVLASRARDDARLLSIFAARKASGPAPPERQTKGS
ncbi:hypothetical protein B0H11DRAFT_2233490 [Mycena galericulata]|nr:hypothetical protein B0H11DRAFT_2233490 [Mycena galericulata]